MLFKKKDEGLAGISGAGLSKWYGALTDRDKVRVRRYAEGVSELSAFDMLLHIIRGAMGDENYDFAAEMCRHAAAFADTDIRRFEINEVSIDALFLSERYEEALELCRGGRDMYVSLRGSNTLSEEQEDFRFRNRTIDILVGHMRDYESADMALEDFFKIGLISKEELDMRKNSLKIHRLQRTFESIYSLSK